MPDSQPALVDVVVDVLVPLPCEAVSSGRDDAVSPEDVVFERRDAGRFLVRWEWAAPPAGSDVDVHVTRGGGVFVLSVRVLELCDGSAGWVEVRELRRRRQRRAAMRARCDDLVLISDDDRDVDAELSDVSVTGFSFVLGRALAIGLSLRAVLNVSGTAIPCHAHVRRVRRLGNARYQVGCSFTQVSDQHRHLLASYAAQNPIDRRATGQWKSLRDRLAGG
jgi:hypothetical protein